MSASEHLLKTILSMSPQDVTRTRIYTSSTATTQQTSSCTFSLRGAVRRLERERGLVNRHVAAWCGGSAVGWGRAGRMDWDGRSVSSSQKRSRSRLAPSLLGSARGNGRARQRLQVLRRLRSAKVRPVHDYAAEITGRESEEDLCGRGGRGRGGARRRGLPG